MRNYFVKLVIKLSGIPLVQKFLVWIISRFQLLIGIGLGGSPELSGEKILIEKLKQQYKNTGNPGCIFDVGANKGKFLELMENGLQGVPFHVHAFEPSHHTYQSLCINAGGYRNVTLNNKGLGKQIGDLELYFNEEGSGLASLYKRRLDHFNIDFKFSEKVMIDTLDNYCLSHDIQKIDLLKLDVEGHELDVLNGGLDMFARKKIGMVSFEFGGCNIDSRTYFQDFYYFFKENGMKNIYRITPSGYLMPILKYDEIYEQFRTTNFLVLMGN